MADEVNPKIIFSLKWGEDELPIIDQYTYLGVDTSKDCSWDTHVAKVIGKGKSHVGKMDAILTDKIYGVINVCDCVRAPTVWVYRSGVIDGCDSMRPQIVLVGSSCTRFVRLLDIYSSPKAKFLGTMLYHLSPPSQAVAGAVIIFLSSYFPPAL